MEKIENKQIEIIRLLPSRWQEYKDLRLEALENDPQAFGSSLTESLLLPDEKWQQRAKDGYEGKVSWAFYAQKDEKLVGTANAYLQGEIIAGIFGVYISPEARGLGLSKKLMNALLEELTKDGISVARLTVSQTQLTAVNLYQSLGFTITAEEEEKLGDGETYPVYLMEKKI